MIVPFAGGIGPGTTTDLTGTGYLIIHPTTDPVHPTEVTITGAYEYDDTNKTYSNVLAGSKIEVKLGVTLSGGDGTEIYDYDGTEFFTFQLPRGITFNPV